MKEEKGNGNPFRAEVEELIEKGEVKKLLKKAGELHGHLCNYLAYGVKAGYTAVQELGVKNTGMEEIIAILETNNCFSDGVQMITGCTFGNNALIYKDIGKTAVTVAKRDGTAIRIALDPEFEDSIEEEYPEAYELWNKIITEREESTPQEYKKMMKLFREMSINELDKPESEMFNIERKKIDLPDYAPIFDSVKCSVCGENIMKPKALKENGKFICKECAEKEYPRLDGSGISMKHS